MSSAAVATYLAGFAQVGRRRAKLEGVSGPGLMFASSSGATPMWMGGLYGIFDLSGSAQLRLGGMAGVPLLQRNYRGYKVGWFPDVSVGFGF
jgi:hypothetical protein